MILLMFVLLMNGRHSELRSPQPPAIIRVSAQPLPLFPDAPAERRLGELVYLGGWALRGSERFGGISSMTVDDGGLVTALSDGGEVMQFRPGRGHFPAKVMLVPVQPWEERASRSLWDTESMALDPASGTRWVGFEAWTRICRYSRDFSAVESCAVPEAASHWANRRGMESLARLPDGRFLAIAEESPGPAGGHDVLLFAGDPVDPVTPPPVHLGYRPPVGYLPTDAIAISPDKLLVLNRRLTLADFFTATLVLIDLNDLRPGALLQGPIVARLADPMPHDNFEALALSHEDGRPVLWIASDDNGLFFQRSLLLKFALPEKWTGK